MFYELVKLVEVNIGEELRCKISERHAFALIFIFIILEYFFDEKYSITIFYFLSDDWKKNGVVNTIEVMFDVSF